VFPQILLISILKNTFADL